MQSLMFRLPILFALLIFALSAEGPQWPKMESVTPESGKAASEFTASGENLGKTKVAEVYLNDGKKDLKCEITGQSSDSIKFRVPSGLKAGKYGLVVMTAGGKQPIEQPVKLTIE
ncbi:MAG: hypothetical protein HYX27_12090 [Acidobacteria bacterium]|nr:hypothetical protein [Acidobacteriota bacterium]